MRGYLRVQLPLANLATVCKCLEHEEKICHQELASAQHCHEPKWEAAREEP